MQPSSIILDPGLERGPPWGRDLFSFVTSAAGYMMRTLQKPRKNKPSKRQVNHRRFLHNMIQRKFAEIEAANQQLASALFTVESETQRPLDAKSESEKNSNNASKGKISTKHQDKENNDIPSEVHNHVVTQSCGKSHLNNKYLNNLNSKEDSQLWRSEEHMCRFDFTSEQEALHAGPGNTNRVFSKDDIIYSPPNTEEAGQISNTHMCKCSNEEENHYLGLSCLDISFTLLDSPLSLDSFDFNVQPNSENSIQIPNLADSLDLDVMEDFEFPDFSEGTERHVLRQPHDRTGMDPIMHMQIKDFQNLFPDPATLNLLKEDQGDGETTDRLEQIRLLCENTETSSGHEKAFFEFSCNEDETMDTDQHQTGLTALINKADQCLHASSWTQSDAIMRSTQMSETLNYSQTEYELSDQFQIKYWEQQTQENQDSTQRMENEPCSVLMNDKFETALQNLDYPEFLSASEYCCSIINRDFCLYTSTNHNQSFPTFDGIAQSFPAPLQNLRPYSVTTPPLSDDWLFSNIEADEDFVKMVRSPECRSR